MLWTLALGICSALPNSIHDDHLPQFADRRQTVESLSSHLLGLIQDNLSSTTLATRDSELRQVINNNAKALNDIGKQIDSAPETRRTALVCKAGQLIYGSRAVTPQQPTYEEEKQENWSTTCWLPAACFLNVRNALEVSIALGLVVFTQTPFAVRSGGHNPSPGFGSIDQSGVLIDLGAMDSAWISADKSIASVGPGATWENIYDYVEQHQLTVAGGRAAGVGAGGLVLGGGMSHFSNHWGLVCDNVKNFEVVLANSTIVQANSKSHLDLFKALKGGGPNFGIVTRFDLHTYPDYRVWYNYKVYNTSNVKRVMQATIEVQKAMETNDKIGFFLNQGVGTLTAGLVYREWTTFPAAFRAFDGIPVLLDAIPATNGTQASFSPALYVRTRGANDQTYRFEIGALTIKPDVQLYQDLQLVLQQIVGNSNLNLGFTYQPLGAPAARQGQAKSSNAVNIRPEPQSWLALVAQWTDSADDQAARSKLRELISRIESTARSRGLLLPFQFQNDASYSQSPLRSYGADSLAHLKTVAGKYDPRQVFQKLQSSGFLVSRA
ncbi:hypothetical protein BDV95DRAFT_492280 [Massariosphaeria phaeospora]|uniref:FAD-binding PCMH-type domain-containing protein n=1 Tax=Massariosphaeria phaeospora TaxID=100035 RepID=A0A7C8M988_9PLEO|nr:hypothetical protein BDV95DRAFT_492280 [Massariosphaeria phaeospora]